MTGTEDWTGRFEGLSPLEAPHRRMLLDRSRIIAADEGACVFHAGTAPDTMLLLLEGSVRVQQTSGEGHEIVLYRIEPGQTCILTTACLLAADDYAASGITETPVKAAAIPKALFDDLMAQSEVFRRFVFAAFSKRFADLFATIDEVAFQRLDMRLSDRLIRLSGGGETVAATHQKLSVELGTAREVISRQLQEFQRRGWIEQSRGNIRLLDKPAIARLADKDRQR